VSDGAQAQVTLENLKTRSTWIRGLFMLLFIAVYGMAEALLGAILLFQFVSLLLTRQTNSRLRDFSRQLCAFLYEIALYLSFNSDDKPYPFGPFPRGR
jgi:hypothetical protein